MKWVLLALVGCAPVNFAQRHSTDTECKPVGSVAVSIQDGAWIGCQEAREAVAKGLEGKQVKEWRVLFVSGFAGFGVDGNGIAHTRSGQCYPETRTIAIVAGKAWLVGHELAHADDVDHGRGNTVDR